MSMAETVLPCFLSSKARQRKGNVQSTEGCGQAGGGRFCVCCVICLMVFLASITNT